MLPSSERPSLENQFKMLDCFCGMGGVSDGFALEGFDVTGIDIEDAPKKLGYKHRFIQADMLTLNKNRICPASIPSGWVPCHQDNIGYTQMEKKGLLHRYWQCLICGRKMAEENFEGYDVIWGSPPCRDFTILNDKHGTKTAWKIPKDPKKGMKLVNAFLSFVEEAAPAFWIMENVFGLEKYLPNPHMKAKLGHKIHVFYGNFPLFSMPKIEKFKIRNSCGWDKLAHWERSKIPLACSRAFARACREALEQRLEVKA